MSKPFPIPIPGPRPIVCDAFDGSGQNQNTIIAIMHDAFRESRAHDRLQPLIIPTRRVVFFCFSLENKVSINAQVQAFFDGNIPAWDDIAGLAGDPTIIGSGLEGDGSPYAAQNPPTTLFNNGEFRGESAFNTFGSFYFLQGGPYWSFLGWTAKRWGERSNPGDNDGWLFCDVMQFRLPVDMHYLIVTASAIGNTLGISGAETSYPDVNQDLYSDIHLTTEADGAKGDIITIKLPEQDPANIPPWDPLDNPFFPQVDGYGVISYFVPDYTWDEYKTIYGIP